VFATDVLGIIAKNKLTTHRALTHLYK